MFVRCVCSTRDDIQTRLNLRSAIVLVLPCLYHLASMSVISSPLSLSHHLPPSSCCMSHRLAPPPSRGREAAEGQGEAVGAASGPQLVRHWKARRDCEWVGSVSFGSCTITLVMLNCVGG